LSIIQQNNEKIYATIVFADSMENHPNIDADKLEPLITLRIKVIVPVQYAGVACDMDKILELADKYNSK